MGDWRPFETMRTSDLGGMLDICLGLREKEFWSFRGQRKSGWNLGLHNFDATKSDVHAKQFCRRCMEFPPPPHIAEHHEWRWLFFAQHHRLKTHLLDWTKDPLVAIYFAVENILSGASDTDDFGVVWALKVAKANFLSAEDGLEDKQPGSLCEWKMINPLPVTERQLRQSSLFSYHPEEQSPYLDESERRGPEERLIRIEIAADAEGNPSRRIRKQLGILNIHHATLFPDPDGIAQFLNSEWDDLQS